MTLWEEIAASALVGCERKPWRPPDNSEPVTAFLTKVSGGPAEQLLKAAAIVRLHTRAGRLPNAPERDLPAPCPVDPRPRCGPRTVWHLRSMLAGTFKAMLPEWLAAVAAAGQRVPEELVPELGAWATRQHRELVTAVVGQLGSWLDMPGAPFRLNPDPSSFSWDEGTAEERVALLESLRRNDPVAAIERIKSTWTVDKAEQRSNFLRTLEHGLSPLDEPFLETVLDDKSIVVRRVAVDLLARIPGAALVQRVIEAVRPCLTVVRKGILRTKAIEVRLLEELSPSLARDGVEKKGAPQGTGEKAWWTQQAISLVPPSLWVESLGMTAEDLIEAAAQGEYAQLLEPAWTNATIRHADADWARSLLLAGSPLENSVRNLFALLPPADRELVALSTKERTVFLIGFCQHPWSLAFTRAVAQQAANWPSTRCKSSAASPASNISMRSPPMPRLPCSNSRQSCDFGGKCTRPSRIASNRRTHGTRHRHHSSLTPAGRAAVQRGVRGALAE